MPNIRILAKAVLLDILFTRLFLYKIPVSRGGGGGGGGSGGVKVLGKLPVPGRPTYLDCSRARAYCTCSRCGWGLFGHFYSRYHFSFLSPSL